MLISITEKCRMGCSHCMDDARADCDKFMTRETFEKAVAFNFKYDPTITITGGEPTEHPEFWEFMKYLSRRMKSNQICTITTNGMNLSNNDIDKIKDLRKGHGEILWQVSSIEPYYPIKIDTSLDVFHLPEVVIATTLEKLEPKGRAADHKEWNFTSKAPACFNIRSLVRSTKNFGTSITSLRMMHKFCTPQIAYDGSVKVGESSLCPKVAHIGDTEMEIVRKICNHRCSGCDVTLKKLPMMYRDAIGES